MSVEHGRSCVQRMPSIPHSGPEGNARLAVARQNLVQLRDLQSKSLSWPGGGGIMPESGACGGMSLPVARELPGPPVVRCASGCQLGAGHVPVPVRAPERTGVYMSLRQKLVAAATAFGLALAAAPVMAQSDSVPVTGAAFSDSQLAAFAGAAIEVAGIRDSYSAALQQVETEAEGQALIDEGNAAMVSAVEDAPGITLEDYISIGEAAAADPELSQRIALLIEGMMEAD